MNEVLDPTSSATENVLAENNLLENAEKQVVEPVENLTTTPEEALVDVNDADIFVPELSEVSEITEVSEIPEIPAVPEVSDIPETPVISEKSEKSTKPEIVKEAIERDAEGVIKEKKSILEELKSLISSQEDFNKKYNEYRHLQQRWKELGSVSHPASSSLWKEYQHYNEIFYDQVRINYEMREYDFKKNLELKTALCESVERLAEKTDIVSAFHQLQKFHQEWRETGPVARAHREEIWTRFRAVSATISKKYEHFVNKLREEERHNLEAKTTICTQIEAINYDELTTFKTWEEKNKQILDLQQTWKNLGFAPKKHNDKIFERFRASCDTFFLKKAEFYRQFRESMETNLAKKKSLCEQAEALKDSTAWKETSEKLIALQKEWKTVGAVSHKYSDTVWHRFIAACDYFFEQKNKTFSSQKEDEVENLRLKNEIIEKINAISESTDANEALDTFHELDEAWSSIGHVPFKEKDKIYKKYRESVDKYFDRLKIDKAERRLQSFKSNISDISGGDQSKNRLLSERDKLMRTFEKLKSDIQTYENNIGFFSVSSKKGDGLIKEMNHKINDLKAELELIIKKIQAIDDSLDNQ
jgi:hypothetical protein